MYCTCINNERLNTFPVILPCHLVIHAAGAEYYSIAPFGPSQNPFVLDGAYCSGTESSLLSCSSSYSVGVHHCHRGQESGVKCQGE